MAITPMLFIPQDELDPSERPAFPHGKIVPIVFSSDPHALLKYGSASRRIPPEPPEIEPRLEGKR